MSRTSAPRTCRRWSNTCINLANPVGALIADIEPGSAADRAGIQSGDVLLAMNGTVLAASGDFSAKLSLAQPGEMIGLDIWHDSARRTLKVRLDDAAAGAAPTQRSVAVLLLRGGRKFFVPLRLG